MRAFCFALLCSIAAAVPAQDVKHELIYGAELMTRSEREQYRYDVQRAKSEDEANKVRLRHREQMQKRARARLEKLDDAGLLVKDKHPGEKK